MKFIQCLQEICGSRLLRKRGEAQPMEQDVAQMAFVTMMADRIAVELRRMRICKGICQIVGQLSECVVMFDRPKRPLLEQVCVSVDIETGVGKIVSAQEAALQGAF